MDRESSKKQILDIVSENIKFLAELDNNSYDAWGVRFGLKRGQVSTYVTKKAKFPIETAIEVCDHYGVSVKDFYSGVLTKSHVHRDDSGNNGIVNEPVVDYSTIPDYPNGLTKEEATALHRQLLKEKRKVEFLTETLKSL